MVNLQQAQNDGELLRAEIAQLKQANQEMQATIHRSRIFSDLISDCTYAFRVDAVGHLALEYSSDRFVEFTGFTPEESEARGGWAALCHPDDLEIAHARAQRLFAGGDNVSEYRILTKNGEVRWMRDYAHPEWDTGKQHIARIYGAVQDITERKHSAEKQRKSEERLRALFNASGIGICLYAVDGTLIDVNEIAAQYLGGKPEYYIGKSVLEIYGPEDGSRNMDRLACAASTEENQTYEDQVTLRTGLKWLQSIYSRLLDDIGKVSGVQIISSDITSLKDALLEVQKAESKFRTVADHTSDWEIWESPTGTLRYMSPSCLRITGYTTQEFYNDADLMLAIVAEDDRQAVLDHRRYKHSTTEPMTMRYRIWHREGTLKWIEHLCQPVWDAEHHYLGRRISNRDISHRIAVTEALREREATLQALYQALPTPTYTWQKMGDDFVLTDFNKAAENATYGKIADLLGAKAGVFYKDQPEILHNFTRCFAEKQKIELEWHNADSVDKCTDLVFRFAYAPPYYILVHIEDVSERVKARHKSQRYISTLQALRNIVRGILQTQSTREIAQSAANQLCQLIDCECVVVLHFDASLKKAVLLAVSGTGNDSTHQGTVLLTPQMCGGIAELAEGKTTHGVVKLHDRRNDDAFGGNTREIINFPLMIHGSLIGCLKLEFAKDNALPVEWEAFVAQVSDELAMVIQQANLREEMQDYIQNMESRIADRTRELSTLYEIADIAGQTLNQHEMVRRILDRALSAMRCHVGAIHFLNAASGMSDQLRLAASQGFPEEFVAQINDVPVTIDLMGRVLNQDVPLVLTAFHNQFPEFNPPFAVHWEHYVGVPIRTNTGPAGILSVIRTKKQPQFTVEDIALLTSISAQIGRAVETDRLRIQAENAAVLQERARLSRELHDSVTQLLYSMTLFAEMASDANAAGESEVCQRSLERIGDIAYQVVKEMRLLLYELMPGTLAHDGLVKALDRRLDSVERRAGIDVNLVVESNPFLTPALELELYRIAQEALNNIILHAEADHIDIRLKREARTIMLRIEDNGIGFDLESAGLGGGLGLKNMHERAERLGSRLDVHSTPGQGTWVQICVEAPDV